MHPPNIDKKIFASYSRPDYERVRPFVEILRVPDLNVFVDRDSIAPGSKWRKAIEEAIHKADIIFVFWTKNASVSEFVRAEYELGLTLKKNVIPVLLDDTPLPVILEGIQGIDFREKFARAKDERESAQAFYFAASGFITEPPRRPRPPNTLLLILAIVSVPLLIWAFYTLYPREPDFTSIPVEIGPSHDSPVRVSGARFAGGQKKEFITRVENVSGETVDAFGLLMRFDCDDRRHYFLLEHGDFSDVRTHDLMPLGKQPWLPRNAQGDIRLEIILTRDSLSGSAKSVAPGEGAVFAFPAEWMTLPLSFKGMRCLERQVSLTPVMAAFRHGAGWSSREQ